MFYSNVSINFSKLSFYKFKKTDGGFIVLFIFLDPLRAVRMLEVFKMDKALRNIFLTLL